MNIDRPKIVLLYQSLLGIYGDHRDLHLSLRRQRQMCIRDRIKYIIKKKGFKVFKSDNNVKRVVCIQRNYIRKKSKSNKQNLFIAIYYYILRYDIDFREF